MCVFVDVEMLRHVVSSKRRVCRRRKRIVMRSKDWIWRGDENGKRKCTMTQRKCLERTGKQVVVQ